MSQVSFDGFIQGINEQVALYHFGIELDLHPYEMEQLQSETNPVKKLKLKPSRPVLKEYLTDKVLTAHQIEKIEKWDATELIIDHGDFGNRKISLVQLGITGYAKVCKKTGAILGTLKSWSGKEYKTFKVMPIYLYAVNGRVREYDEEECGW